MAKFKKILIINLIVILGIIGLVGCNNSKEVENLYKINDFENDMKSKGYNFTLENLEPYFMSTESKSMKIDETIIAIYSYKNNKNMENDAEYINSDGSGYNNGKEAMEIDWVSKPHFYKKGNLIVNYVGEDEKIIKDLQSIFGEQFAGMN